MVKLGLIQMRCSINPLENVDKAEKMIRQAASEGAHIICLQEIFNTIYFCQSQDHSYFRFAEGIPGPTTTRLGKIAKELGLVIVAPIFERRAAGVYHNSAAIIDADGSCLGKYRKMHIPDDPLFYEKFYFSPGDLGFRSWKTRFATIGVLICWDQWYPEAARLTALSGAEILFYPTAIGWATAQDETTNTEQFNGWQTIHRSHAVANGVHVVSVNRVGFEQDGKMKFWGGSFVANPFGNLIYN